MREAMPPLPKSYIVRGNMDLEGRYNLHEEIKIEDINILLLHGTQIKPRGDLVQLLEIADHVNADVTVHGHTHNEAIDLYERRLFLNPGTISGSTGGWEGRTDASFIELGISQSRIEVSLYHTDWVDTRISKVTFIKSGQVISLAQSE
jgi:putative phosphoesterase